MKIRVALFLTLTMLLVSCSSGETDAKVVRRAIARTLALPHHVTYTETTEDGTVEVKIDVEDSFRSHVLLTQDGHPLLEQVFVDDALALRLLDPARWNPAAGSPLERVLGSGAWVVDPSGATPLMAQGSARRAVTRTGFDVLDDAERSFEYTRAAMDQGVTVTKLNPYSLSYRPSEDPFRRSVDADRKRGVVRYDTIAPPLPRTPPSQGATFTADTRFFRKLAVYLKGNRVVRVREVVDFEHHTEIVKAKERGKPKFLLRLLLGLRKGVGEDPVRPRRMRIDVSPWRNPKVELPAGATPKSLAALGASGALSHLPGRKAPKTGGPYLPLPTPGAGPAASPNA